MTEPLETDLIRVRLDLAYDGTDFRGWARQPGLRTVQGELEEALEVVFTRHGPPPLLTVAGRTDAGVHALGQVAHLDLTPAQLASLERPHRGPARGKKLDGLETLARRLNGIAGLSADIFVARASLAPPGFDARFSGIWRRYEYRVADPSGPRNPIERNRTLWWPHTVKLGRMTAAAEVFLGLHDFASFCKARDTGTTIRTLQSFTWTREPDGVLIARLQADAFCHSMVRALVGASLAVGEGRLPIEQITVIREQRRRTEAFKVVPAKGLTLMAVGYPPDDELAARALQTRAIRTPLEPPLGAFDTPGLTDLPDLD